MRARLRGQGRRQLGALEGGDRGDLARRRRRQLVGVQRQRRERGRVHGGRLHGDGLDAVGLDRRGGAGFRNGGGDDLVVVARIARRRRQLGQQLFGLPALHHHGRGARGRGVADMFVDQAAHFRIAHPRGAAAEHHGDEMALGAMEVDHDVEAGIADIAGLHAVDAGHAPEQVVVVAHRPPVPDEAADREEMEILRETVLQGAGEDGLVARRGDLPVVGQAGGVVVVGVHHAERARLGRHHPAEGGFAAAAHRFGHHHRHVVGGLGHDGLDGVLDLDVSPGLSPSLEGACAAAWADTSSGVDILILPAASRSNSR